MAWWGTDGWSGCGGSPLQDVVRDAAGADLAECGSGGDHGGAPWEEAEAEAQSERGEVGAGSSGEEGAGGEGRRHGHGHDTREPVGPFPLVHQRRRRADKRKTTVVASAAASAPGYCSKHGRTHS